MKALLRADWLRFRRRRDFWVILAAVLVIGSIVFLNAYQSDVTDPTVESEAQLRQDAKDFLFTDGTPEEIAAGIEQYVADQRAQNESYIQQWEANQLVSLPRYAFPQSIFTFIGAGLPAILALILIATLAVGDEFRFGTIRTSLLAAGHRRHFLLARLASLLALTAGLFLVLALVGAVCGFVLGLLGADLGGAVPPIDGWSGLAWFGSLILGAMVLIALGTALTVLLRSGALPLLLMIIAGLIELFVAHLPFFAPQESLAGVPQGFLLTSVRVLTPVLGLQTHALALSDPGEIPFAAIDIPLFGVALIVVAWGLLFVWIADRRLHSMDVVE